MTTDAIHAFGELLVRQVRDEAIRACDSLLLPQARNPIALRWREAIASGNAVDAVVEVIPDCVDEAVFQLLRSLDDGAFRLIYRAAEGELVDLGAEGQGELGGWFMGSDGWRTRYSTERVADDSAAIADENTGS